MSQVQQVSVRMAVDAELITLLSDIEAAHRRGGKSEPGERDDIVRYEALCASLEARAASELLEHAASSTVLTFDVERIAGSFIRDGAGFVVVPLTLPLESGRRSSSAAQTTAPPPAAPMELRDDIVGRRLVEARFKEQLGRAITHPGADRSSVLSPSGIHNRVLTEVLRSFVDREGESEVAVPVVYRDGSKAQDPFRFRSLDLIDQLCDPTHVDLDLRLTLLSIRHTEMDPVVDGAWLRNSEVSRPRPAAETDDFVYQTSCKQLDALTGGGSLKVRLHIFQTGLETAVVGFFRAVVDFLSRHPGKLEVVPMFYSAPGKNQSVPTTVEDEFAGFARGQVWATAEV